eukprot:scaffold79208_cov38-Cyclotella_meneghiniana.AAC.4
MDPSHPPSSNGHSTMSLAAIHPQSDNSWTTSHKMQCLLPVNPPSPTNQMRKESDFEDEDYNDLLQTHPTNESSFKPSTPRVQEE